LLIFRAAKFAAGVALVVWAAAFLRPLPAQQGPPPFGPGEKLRYEVQWRLIPAGEAELSLEHDNDSGWWKAVAKAHSLGYVSNLYKVEDEYRAVFRNPTFCSVGIRKEIHEGERHRDVEIEFNLRRRLALLRDRDVTGNTPPRQEQFSIPECVHDILSALYFVRAQPLAVGRAVEFPLNDGARTHSIRLEVQALEEVQTELGRFQAFRVEPDVFAGQLFKQKGRMFVWFSNDAQHLPVQLRAQIGIGTIVASLAGVEREEAAR
jgi:hypothetical protein